MTKAGGSMDIHDIGANLERALLAEAWRHVPDGDGEDPLELGSGLRLSAQGSDSDALAELVATVPGHLLLSELRRIELAEVGPPRGFLRSDGGPTPARVWLTSAVALRSGRAMRRLAASGPTTVARYGPVQDLAVDGAPECTLSLRLEPTTDDILLGSIERRGADQRALELILATQAQGVVGIHRLAESERVLVFYQRDMGEDATAWAHVVE